MGLKHEAKKGTVIEANGVRVLVLRGSPHLEISAPPGITIEVADVSKPSDERRNDSHSESERRIGPMVG